MGCASRQLFTKYSPISILFVMVTGRVLQHYNSGTMTRRTRLAQVVDRDLLEIHTQDAKLYGLAEHDRVIVRSRRDSTCLTAHINERVAQGTLFTTFHFPEAQVNTLLSSSSDIITRCLEYKVLAVSVERLPYEAR